MRIPIVFLIYCIEMLKYHAFYYLYFHKKLQVQWGLLIGIIGTAVISCFHDQLDISEGYLLIYLTVIGTVITMLPGKMRERVYTTIFCLFPILCVDEVVHISYEMMSFNGMHDDTLRMLETLPTLFIFVLMLGLIRNGRSKEFINRIKHFFDKHTAGIVLAMALNLLCSISLLSYMKKNAENEKQQIIIMIVCGISYIVIGITGATMIHIKNLQRKLEQLVVRETMLKDAQKKYYETLLEKEEDTRKYRHDMSNHLICLKSLCSEQKYQELDDYLYHMIGDIRKINRKEYMLGNSVVDAITNYYVSMLPETVQIQVEGRIDESIRVEGIDLCTIYANLLQNSVEAIQRHVNKTCPYLKIIFRRGTENFQIEIINSNTETAGLGGPQHMSSKTDHKNHGIGLNNVREILEKCGGTLETEEKAGKYVAKVTIRLTA